jgi:ethanolamine utilization microcompartment shell protein EutL
MSNIAHSVNTIRLISQRIDQQVTLIVPTNLRKSQMTNQAHHNSPQEAVGLFANRDPQELRKALEILLNTMMLTEREHYLNSETV